MSTASTAPALPTEHCRLLLNAIKDFYSVPANRAEFEQWREERHKQPSSTGEGRS